MLNHLEEGATVYIRKNKLDAVPGSSLLKSGTLNTNIKFISKLSQKEGTVNREYSYKSDYEDYLNALEQDDEGTKSNFASLEENAPPEREEADGFDEVYEYLMDEDLEQYDRDHEDKFNALTESEAPEETALPTITRKDLDDYSKLMTDSGETVSKLGKMTGDKYLYDYYDPI